MAVWLLMLAVSPFTAPFATLDLAELGGDAPIHGDPLSSSKAPKEALAPNVASATIAPLLNAIYLPLATPAGRVAPPARFCSPSCGSSSAPSLVYRTGARHIIL